MGKKIVALTKIYLLQNMESIQHKINNSKLYCTIFNFLSFQNVFKNNIHRLGEIIFNKHIRQINWTQNMKSISKTFYKRKVLNMKDINQGSPYKALLVKQCLKNQAITQHLDRLKMYLSTDSKSEIKIQCMNFYCRIRKKK